MKRVCKSIINTEMTNGELHLAYRQAGITPLKNIILVI